jgi:hypothetical protein
MKHYNIEDQLQRKLRERSITPSAEAWERIAFNRQQQKKKRKAPFWYWVAAALVISMGGLVFFFATNTTMPVQPQVVIEEAKPVKADAAPEVMEEAIQETEIVSHEVKRPGTELPHAEKSAVITATVHEKVSPIAALPDPEIVKANEVAIAIHHIAEVKGEVTEHELDSLLKNAQRQIAMEKLKSNNQPTNDTALLNEAEKEMESSFRDKTLSIFKRRFKTIKIALKDQ